MRMTRSQTRRVVLLTLCVAMSATGGCRTRLGGGKASEAAALSRRVDELERELREAKLRGEEAEAKLTSAAKGDDEVVRATPMLAGIEIDRLSGPTPGDRDGFPVYVRTLDGRGRFIQAVGRLEIEVFVADASDGPAVAPVRVGGASLGPLELREAYRASVMGIHYRADVVADAAFVRGTSGAELAVHDLRIVARLTDALTGRVHEATTVIPARIAGQERR